MGKDIAPAAKGFVEHVFSLHRPSELEELLSEWSAFEEGGGGGMECEQPIVIARARK